MSLRSTSNKADAKAGSTFPIVNESRAFRSEFHYKPGSSSQIPLYYPNSTSSSEEFFEDKVRFRGIHRYIVTSVGFCAFHPVIADVEQKVSVESKSFTAKLEALVFTEVPERRAFAKAKEFRPVFLELIRVATSPFALEFAWKWISALDLYGKAVVAHRRREDRSDVVSVRPVANFYKRPFFYQTVRQTRDLTIVRLAQLSVLQTLYVCMYLISRCIVVPQTAAIAPQHIYDLGL